MVFGLATAGGKDIVQILIQAKDQTAAAFKAVEGSMNKLDATAAKVRNGVNKVAKATLAIGGAATIAAIGLSTKTFMGFEQSIANTASVSGAAGEELKKLEDAAREMGKTTAFSASEAADAMYYLGSAGYDTEQIISSLNGVMLLAGATQSDLAFTASTVVSTLNAFGMAAEESDRVANVFAATIANSQATMDKLANSMSYVAPLANTLGYEVEELSAALGMLYNAGYDGSMAGTILRGALTQLLNPTAEVSAALNRLGIEIYKQTPEVIRASDEFNAQTIELQKLQAEYDALTPKIQALSDEMSEFSDKQEDNRLKIRKIRYDASKEGRELTEAEEETIEALELENEKLGISYDELRIEQRELQKEQDKTSQSIDVQAEKYQAAADELAGIPKELKDFEGLLQELEQAGLSGADGLEIFGQRAGPGMLALISQGTPVYEGLLKDITDTTAASDMYATQMNTQQGILTKLKSALGDMAITIGKDLKPHIIALADAIKDNLPKLMEFASKLKEELQPAIDNLKPIFESLKGIMKDLFTGMEGTEGGVIDTINSVVEVIAKLFKFLDEHPNVVKGILMIAGAFIAWAEIMPIITAISAALAGGTGLSAIIAALGGPIGLIVLAVAALFIAWETNFMGIRDKTKAVYDFIKPYFNKIKDYLGLLLGPIGWVYTVWKNWDKIKEIVGGLADTVREKIEAIKGFFDDLKTGVGLVKDMFHDKFSAMKDKIGEFTTDTLDKLGLSKKELLAMASPAGPIVLFKKAWDSNFGGIQDKVTEVMATVKDKVQSAVTTIRTKIDELGDLPGKAYEWGKNLIQSFIDGITDLLAELEAKVNEVADLVKSYIGISSPAEVGPLANLEKWGPNLVKTFSEGIANAVPNLNFTLDRIATPTAVITGATGAIGTSAGVGGPVTIGPNYFTVDSPEREDAVVRRIEAMLKTKRKV